MTTTTNAPTAAPTTAPAASTTATLITTGGDVADETRAFTARFAEIEAGEPKMYEIGAPEVRARQRRGAGAYVAPTLLPQGVDRVVPGRSGRDIPVRVFTPPQVDGVVLHIHGGGWTVGSEDGQDLRLWELAEAANLAVVSVGYRLAPEHPFPAGANDCEDVARWLIFEADAEFGTDRLVITGESAGAHLAVLTLLRLGGKARAFRAAQLTYGAYDLSMTPSQRQAAGKLFIPTDILAWCYDNLLPGLSPEERRAPGISPLYADLRNLPPARFVVGTEDPFLDDNLFMAARWRAAGNEAELEVVAEAMHGFVLFPGTASDRERARRAEFLARALNDLRQ